MIDIFICANSSEEREALRNNIEKFIFVENFNMRVAKVTDNPYEILNEVKDRSKPSIYFLNIYFDSDINGIKLGAKIREYDKLGVIVYITPHLEMVYLSYIYKVEALDYIIRDSMIDIDERIRECITIANRKLNTDEGASRRFKIKNQDKVITIAKSEIIYFETSEKPHKINLHKMDGKIEFVGKLKDIEESIGKGFFRCHKSYLINKNKVKEIDIKEKTVLMANGDVCLVSKRFMHDLIEKI